MGKPGSALEIKPETAWFSPPASQLKGLIWPHSGNGEDNRDGAKEVVNRPANAQPGLHSGDAEERVHSSV